jgi:signal transduction histidine kinase
MTKDGKDTAMSMEEQIVQLKAQLAHAQRLTALGELLGTTTHEFNNVLMTVINYAKMGLRHTDEATRTKALERILTAGERANKISSTILSVARNRSHGMEPTNLVSLTEDTLVLLERELRKYRISVEKQFDEVPDCWANGNQIQQVLMNLMINARQAMPNGGRLMIAIRPGPESVEISLRDTGGGIPPDQLPKIFDSFYSTKDGPDESGKGGTGLGLSACKDIIEAHRGRVRVESSVGKGTAFTIRLPLVPTRPPQPAFAKTAPQATTASANTMSPSGEPHAPSS